MRESEEEKAKQMIEDESMEDEFEEEVEDLEDEMRESRITKKFNNFR
jgi:hypothetical protein